MTDSPSIVLFQTDLRLADNPALTAAVQRGKPLICLYVWNPDAKGYDKPGAASRWWLHYSLEKLSSHIQQTGNDLVIRTGQTAEVVSSLAAQFKTPRIFWNRSCEPAFRKIEHRLQTFLKGEGGDGTGFDGTNLADPDRIQTQSGTPYTVFTPFWKKLQTVLPPSPPLAAPQKLPSPPSTHLKSETLASLKLLPKIDWAHGLRNTWSPGEEGARSALKKFLLAPAKHYSTDRDRPDLPHTSQLSSHLHFGEISPRTLCQAITSRMGKCQSAQERKSLEAYLRQLGWREFARYLLYHFPETAQEPLYAAYKKFPWDDRSDFLAAWQNGLTGYPIVDAGMRELWQTGWMHNRVRMITASFLTKDLLLHWKAGADWFWDTLVDADLANNTLGWQWVAGCGADASPFFRIFNPITQGRKFDPDGRYVRKWVPELAGLPHKWIHQPWEAPPLLLVEAQVRLGETYPYPIIDHAAARNRALLAYRHFTKNKHSNTSSPTSDSGKCAST
ncbi:MAG: deoxyribodipyrimidine photo-lyase [Nitrospirales bacterium]|nr:DNA photolyase family protein [Nitrospirales bacterium]